MVGCRKSEKDKKLLRNWWRALGTEHSAFVQCTYRCWSFHFLLFLLVHANQVFFVSESAVSLVFYV